MLLPFRGMTEHYFLETHRNTAPMRPHFTLSFSENQDSHDRDTHSYECTQTQVIMNKVKSGRSWRTRCACHLGFDVSWFLFNSFYTAALPGWLTSWRTSDEYPQLLWSGTGEQRLTFVLHWLCAKPHWHHKPPIRASPSLSPSKWFCSP